MNRILTTIIALSLAACATEVDAEHLSETDPSVVHAAATWGAGGIAMPKKLLVQPGDHVERYTRTCELVEPGTIPYPGECRAPLDAECNEDGGIPLPDFLMRGNRNEDGDVVSITVTIKCRFPGGES
jgi:hypothetical protein